MRAAFITEPGPAESILVGELPAPEPGDREVLVRIAAAALNPVDTYIRAGAILMNLPRPFIVGCDFAGSVEAVGPGVKQFTPGTRVWGSNQGLLGRQGTFAELAAVGEEWVYATPENVSDETAAAISLVGITAHLGLFRDAGLQPGETLFVHGGSGGVGSAVVQMAKAVGARVITTAGSDAKVRLCHELGADEVIQYKTENEVARIRDLAPDGVHVWFETLREPNFDRAIDLLAEKGRMIVMAGRDARPPFPVGPFYVKGCRLFGFVMFKATPEEQQRAATDINRWLVEGRLRPRIDRIVRLEETPAMHALQEANTIQGTGTISGKIVVRM